MTSKSFNKKASKRRLNNDIKKLHNSCKCILEADQKKTKQSAMINPTATNLRSLQKLHLNRNLLVNSKNAPLYKISKLLNRISRKT